MAETVLLLPIVVAPVTPTLASPISAKAIVPEPVALIARLVRAIEPPIVPPNETAPPPEVRVRPCAPSMVEFKLILPLFEVSETAPEDKVVAPVTLKPS